jgi:hypothetical protein
VISGLYYQFSWAGLLIPILTIKFIEFGEARY